MAERRSPWRAFKDVATGVSGLVGTVAAAVTVLATLGLLKATGPDGSKAAASSTPTRGTVVVANVYDLPAPRAVGILRRQGFTHVRTEQVCSNSVAPGRVRQVLLDDHAATIRSETVVVDEQGTVQPAMSQAVALMLKVSDGPCGARPGVPSPSGSATASPGG